ncbi:MAG: inositol monophosphatase family protein [Paracoccaceae bacterium]|nr:inositol monophosphatase family protein [Paracoccaceae bacterium]
MKEQEKLNFISLAKKIALLGGEEALSYFRHPNLRVDTKGSDIFDPVTEADIASEDKMRSYIQQIRPDDTILGEERGVSEGSSDFTWVLDPIDGTRAFISGIPVWTVLVSLSQNSVPILGVIYQPFTKEFFVGGLGVSDYTCKGFSTESIARKCGSLSKAFLSSTFPEIGTEFERKAFEGVASKVKLCRYGMDAYAYALLATGHLDIVVEAGLKSYDVQAPIAVIEAAGGIMTDWKGGPATNGGRVLACGDELVHKIALEMLSINI